MENLSNTNPTSFIFRENVWYCNVIICGILGVISLYLVIALIFHHLKIEKPRKQRFLQLTWEDKFAVLSKFSCIIIGVASLIRNWMFFGRVIFEYHVIFNNYSSHNLMVDGSAVCDTILTLGNMSFTVASGLVYLFLWFRQRVFYIHPSLKILNNKLVQGFSNSVMIIWLLYYLTTGLCYFILVRYDFRQEGGCVINQNSLHTLLNLIVSWATVSIVMQIILLGLFAYPILKRASWRVHHEHDHHNSCLIIRVKKAIILTSISLLIDVFSITSSLLFNPGNTNEVLFDFSLNLMINHLVTIACFDHWKELLWPWNFKISEKLHQNGKKSETTSLA